MSLKNSCETKVNPPTSRYGLKDLKVIESKIRIGGGLEAMEEVASSIAWGSSLSILVWDATSISHIL